MDDCIFCKIAEKEIKSNIVYEDENIIAFDDISPQAPVHVVIITKKHVKSVDFLREEDKAMAAEIILSFGKIARIKKIEKEGYRIVSNHLESAGQSVFHLHFHLLGGRKMDWPPG